MNLAPIFQHIVLKLKGKNEFEKELKALNKELQTKGMSVDIRALKEAQREKLKEIISAQSETHLAEFSSNLAKVAAGYYLIKEAANMARWAIDATAGAAFRSMVKRGEEIYQAEVYADTLEMSVEQMQKLSAAAVQIDKVTPKQFAFGMDYLARNIARAAEGAKEASGSFKQAGVNIFKNGVGGEVRSTYDIFMDLADKLSDKGMSAAKRIMITQQLFNRLFGKNAALILSHDSTYLKKIGEEFKGTGAVIGEELKNAAKDFFVAKQRLDWSMEGIANTWANPDALKALEKFYEAIGRLMQTATVHKIVRRFSDLFIWFIKAATTGVNKLSDALDWLNAHAKTSAAAGALLNTILTALHITLVGLAGYAVYGLGLAIGRLIVTFGAILGPAAAVIAALTAIYMVLDDIAVGIHGGESFTKDFMTWLNAPLDKNSWAYVLQSVLNDIIKSFKELDAIRRGDFFPTPETIEQKVKQNVIKVLSPSISSIPKKELEQWWDDLGMGSLGYLGMSPEDWTSKPASAPAPVINYFTIGDIKVESDSPNLTGKDAGILIADELRRQLQDAGTTVGAQPLSGGQ
jgi:hypothetical protein